MTLNNQTYLSFNHVETNLISYLESGIIIKNILDVHFKMDFIEDPHISRVLKNCKLQPLFLNKDPLYVI